MNKNCLTQLIQSIDIYKKIVQAINEGAAELAITGLIPSAKGYLLSALYHDFNKPLLIICPEDDYAYSLMTDMKFFTQKDIYHYPSRGILPYESMEPLAELTAERILIYEKLLNWNRNNKIESGPIIITTIKELAELIVPPEILLQFKLEFQIGQEYRIDKIRTKLTEMGYDRMPMVEQRGNFASRGDILDIYPITSDHPIRFEFYNFNLESIRYFRLSDQRSFQNIDSISIYPATESGLVDYCLENNIKLKSLSSYFPQDGWVILDEPTRLKEIINEYQHLIKQRYDEIKQINMQLPPPAELYLDFNYLINEYRNNKIIQFSILTNPPALIQKAKCQNQILSFDLPTRSIDSYRGNIEQFCYELIQWHKEGKLILLICDNSGQKERFLELLQERDIIPSELTGFNIIPEKPIPILITIGELSTGFILPSGNLHIITDRDIFTRYIRVRHYRRFREGIPITDIQELQPGDYIVHIDHGIGKYLGIRQMNIDNNLNDYITLEYADGDKLYLPIIQIQLIHKYIARDDYEPKLNRIGDKSWLKAKSKAQASIEKMANELLELYSYRQAHPGYSFSPDTIWQNEFEASFIYDETPDQLKSIRDVKKDMELNKPMDRLLCGDVGFGKTEIAIRAAFKAVMDKKQVAVLVPTTILAEQHWYTFTDRLSGYPITIEMLSRFRNPKQQKRILEGLITGTVDIIIGTHRLLSKDIKFKEIGLLIIDEEQRFGVKHKEKLKQLKKQLDVLTLTATPIPRTLYLSLSGIRDMSLINTPPQDRLPIQTFIHRFDKNIIQEAVLRELNRGGQIYMVHNRVESIYRMVDLIQEIIPQARIAIAHGQMPENELEKVMLDFISKRYDILVSTTIIENGLDIPNVNTIIIDRADALGLSQLYQLRGRVGRDRHQAYAYLLIPSRVGISDIAARRLRTIQEFTELGSGFKIAMRDLEIRGMGNILGKEQTGHIQIIGFDLYCKMVEETIARLKGEPTFSPVDTKLDLYIDAYIPSEYIENENIKFNFYRKLMLLKSKDEIESIRQELIDRFGILPQPVILLLSLLQLRLLASALGIQYIRFDKESITIRWRNFLPNPVLENLSVQSAYPIQEYGKKHIVLYRSQSPSIEPIHLLESILNQISSFLPEYIQKIG